MKLGLTNFIIYAVFGVMFEIIIAVFIIKLSRKLFKKNALEKLVKQDYTYIIDGKRLDFKEERKIIEESKNNKKASNNFFFIPFRKKAEPVEKPIKPEVIEKNEAIEIKQDLKQNLKFKPLNQENLNKETPPINTVITKIDSNDATMVHTSNETGFVMLSPGSLEKKENSDNGNKVNDDTHKNS